jgi:DNA recombination protein RmuC
MTEALLIAVLIVGIANLALVILLIGGRRDAARDIDRLKRDMLDEQRALRAEVSENTRRSINAVGETLLNEYQRDTLNQEQRFKTFALENAQRMEQIRRSVERQLADIREDNGKKLDEMRSIVDEKLQKTLEDKLSRSFALVSERLEQVYKGLGEMQTLASGVGDLSKVLSNVKTRGILGEIQLGAILGEMMAPEQYEVNAKVKQATNERVEFAIKLPADDGTVLLPIDSKFPADAYTNLMDAYEQGNADAVKAAQAVLKGRIKEFAADIAKKYINPPYTTEFAVMFLPTEGLYAEVLRLNLMEPIQREYRVSIAGPSTMAALLNSLQMGFKSVAIQKRSGEVWKVLGAVKTEFASFEKTLAKTRDRLRLADEELGRLIGARTHKINRSLERVTALPAEDGVAQLVDKYAGADDEDEQ